MIPTLADLIANGTLDRIADFIVQNNPKGADITSTDILYDAVVALTPPLLPSTFNALLIRVNREVQNRWNDQEGLFPSTPPLPLVPIQPERQGVAGDFEDRLLYRVIVYVPQADGSIQPRTVYIPSNRIMTIEELKAAALAYINMQRERNGTSFSPGLSGTIEDANVILDRVSRLY
jgi:hypothetical protein